MAIFQYPVRIYYEDTDAGGVVYHARYLHFFERARTELLRGLGFSQQLLLAQENIAFVVKTMQIDYDYPAKLDDLLFVKTQVSELKGATLMFSQVLKRDDVVLCQAKVKIACVDLNKMKPVAIPQQVKAMLKTNL